MCRSWPVPVDGPTNYQETQSLDDDLHFYIFALNYVSFARTAGYFIVKYTLFFNWLGVQAKRNRSTNCPQHQGMGQATSMHVSMVRQKESKGFMSEQRWQISLAVVNITTGPQGIVLVWLGIE